MSWIGRRSHHQADGGTKPAHRSKVGAQVTNRAFVGDERQKEGLVARPARPLHGHTECLRYSAPGTELGRGPRWKVHRQRAIRPLVDRENTAPGGEPNRPTYTILKQAVGRGESGVAAEIDLDRRRGPPGAEVKVCEPFTDLEARIGHIRGPP